MKNQTVLVVGTGPICSSLSIVSKIIDSTSDKIVFTTPENAIKNPAFDNNVKIPITIQELPKHDMSDLINYKVSEKSYHTAPSYHKLGKHKR